MEVIKSKCMEAKKIKEYKERFMPDPDNCILYGEANGELIGAALDPSAPCNQFIIGGTGTGKTQGYVMCNLKNGKTSAVITGGTAYNFKINSEYFKSKGIKLHTIDYVEDSVEESGRYNPFLHLDKHKSLEENAAQLSTDMKRVFVDTEKDLDADKDVKSSAEFIIMNIIVLHMLANDMPDEKKSFKTIFELLDTVKDYAVIDASHEKALSEQLKAKSKEDIELAVTNWKNAFKTANFTLGYADSRAFDIFEERPETNNIKVEDFRNELHYLFVVAPENRNQTVGLAASFLLLCLMREMTSVDFIDKNHVQFYLDDFRGLRLPGLNKVMEDCSSSNAGISLVLMSITNLKDKYSKTWDLFPSHDIIFLGNQGDDDADWLSGIYPDCVICPRDIKEELKNRGLKEKDLTHIIPSFISERRGGIAFIRNASPIIINDLDRSRWSA